MSSKGAKGSVSSTFILEGVYPLPSVCPLNLQIHLLKADGKQTCTHCHLIINSGQIQANTGKLMTLPIHPHPNSDHGNGNPCNALPYHLHLTKCLRKFILARARLKVPIHEFAGLNFRYGSTEPFLLLVRLNP